MCIFRNVEMSIAWFISLTIVDFVVHVLVKLVFECSETGLRRLLENVRAGHSSVVKALFSKAFVCFHDVAFKLKIRT